jgi:dual specificity protein phosphatase-like protein
MGSGAGSVQTVSETGQTVIWTTDSVDLPGVDPAEPPTELIEGKLWHGGCPVDFQWVRATGIDVVLDLADADAYPPADEIDGLTYLKCPLVDEEEVPDPAVTLPLAGLVAGLLREQHQALVHCTFGRNRSGLLVTLIVRDLLGISGEEALRYVQARRERVVNNEAFAEWLASLPAPD